MPAEAQSDRMNAAVRTLKHCLPMIDSFAVGIMFPLAADVEVTDHGLVWDWQPPLMPDDMVGRSPIGAHVADQASGAPLHNTAGHVVKFMNFWTLETPPGTSTLFTHPLNRDDLPFRTLSGVVDTDSFGAGYVHFPATWHAPDFRGMLKAGTPVAQAIVFERKGYTLDIAPQTAAERQTTRDVQEHLSREKGVYRKTFRAGRG